MPDPCYTYNRWRNNRCCKVRCSGWALPNYRNKFGRRSLQWSAVSCFKGPLRCWFRFQCVDLFGGGASDIRIFAKASRPEQERYGLNSRLCRENTLSRSGEGWCSRIEPSSRKITTGYLADLVAIDSTHQHLCGLTVEQLFDGVCFAANDSIVSDVGQADVMLCKVGSTYCGSKFSVTTGRR